MSTILTTLGLRAAAGQQPPNHASTLLLANWLLVLLTNSRILKMYYRIDHNEAPREDLAKYGEAAVQAGKLSRRTLNMIKRQEAAHANAIEGYPVFVAAILLSVYAGVPNETINKIGVCYTVSRVAFSILYSYIETGPASYLRSLAWWSGNISCITGLVLASKRL